MREQARKNPLSVDFSSMDIQLKSQRDYLSQQLETLDYSKIIVPVNVGVKYRPPKLGIEFHLKNDESFNQSLSSRRGSNEQSLLINDIDNFRQKLLVHEIKLDQYFFTKYARIQGEESYDANRVNQHESPMKRREQLSAQVITRQLFNDPQNRAFLNPNILKFEQIARLIQRMIDRYTKFYEQRSASRERTSKAAAIAQSNDASGSQEQKMNSQANLI